MKKINYLFLAGAAALASCSSDEFIGEQGYLNQNGNGEINFSPSSPNMTRATLFGSGAAAKLSDHFVVYGTKHTAAEDKTATNDALVFNQYNVLWNGNAGSTQTNVAGWEYVGQNSYSSSTTSQTAKYWDYSAENGYTFTAFSAAAADVTYPQNSSSNKVIINKITTDDGGTVYTKGYDLTVKTTADKSKLYFSDRVVVPKTQYDKTVSLTFRNICAKVRVGFYETIPGYKVKIDNFRIDDDAVAVVTTFAAMKDSYSSGFAASLQNVKTNADQTFKVTYNDNTNAATENHPKLSNPDAGYDYTLKLGSGVIGNDLGTTASAPTWDKASGEYTDVFPFESNTNPMIIKLDFTMTSEDGSNETIEVKGARAIIPAQYVQWKSNFAYTYIFKISDATNGTTGVVDGNDDPTTDPEGLKPITFDAVVIDAATDMTQQTITTVATNSVTTYQEGVAHETTNEYKKDKAIYVVNSLSAKTGETTVITPTAIGTAATNAQVYTVTGTASEMSEAGILAELTGCNNGLTLTETSGATIETTVPLADGTTPNISNVKFTPSAAGTYAYVYTIAAYVAPTYTIEAAVNSYDSSKTYYMQVGTTGIYYAVTVPNAAAYAENKANLYQQTAAGTPGKYDIKVIKVVD